MHPDFVVGWGTLALINATLAQIKNNAKGSHGFGGLAWFLISLVIGPLATFWILMFKD